MVKTPSRRSSLQQERSVRSREALIDAAAELWTDADVDEVKVEEICATAGVSKGLFYFYFDSREALLVELLADDLASVGAAIDVGIAAGDDVATILDAGLAVLVRRAQQRPRHVLARATAEWLGRHGRTDRPTPDGPELIGALTALVTHGQEHGSIADEWTATEIATLLGLGLVGATLEWATSASRQPSLARRLATRTDLVLRGAAAA